MIFNNRKNISKIQFLFFVLVIFLFCSLVLALPRISIPLSLAYVLSLALSPIVNTLMSFKISKNLSILIIFAILGALIIVPIIKIIPNLSNESQNIQLIVPKVENLFIEKFHDVQNFIKNKTGHEISETYVHQAINEIQNGSTKFVLFMPTLFASLLEWLFLVPFFTFFIIKDSDLFKKMLLSFTPNMIFERFYYVIHVFNLQLGDYLFAKLVEALIVGSIITIGLISLDIKYAAILGLVAGVTNIVPYLGPFLGLAPALIVCVAEYGINSQSMGAILILYSIANAVDAFIVFPFLVSKIVNLHPMVVAISVIVGSHYLGITGMIISIPVVAALKLIISEIYNEIYTERSR